ncbi:hypothetical protein DYQ95_00665 [Xanthomonas sp. LMG 9002]|nr:hypothetical protein [Xanthomonas sp. LMG 9002]
MTRIEQFLLTNNLQSKAIAPWLRSYGYLSDDKMPLHVEDADQGNEDVRPLVPTHRYHSTYPSLTPLT